MQASCSSRVDDETFFDSIHQTAREAGRQLTEIERSGHALDHPIGFNEGAYLKCLFAIADLMKLSTDLSQYKELKSALR